MNRILQSRRVRGRGPVIILCLLMVSGCGIKWWYNHVDYLMRLRIDRYFDITSQQEAFVINRLEEHMRWHRYKGVPVHIRFLAETQRRVADGVAPDEIFWFFDQYREQLRLIVERLSADSVQFLMQLEEEQIDGFAEQLKEENEAYDVRLNMSVEERRAHRADSTIEFLEEWLGGLSDEQESEVRKLSQALPDRFEPWYRKRLERQQSFIKTLRTGKEPDKISQGLLEMLLPAPQRKDDPALEPIVKLILAIDRMATPGQRQYTIDKLQKWIDGLQEISGQRST